MDMKPSLHTRDRTQTEDVWEQGAKEIVRVWEEGSNRRLVKLSTEEL
jgi:hypothetical protein